LLPQSRLNQRDYTFAASCGSFIFALGFAASVTSNSCHKTSFAPVSNICCLQRIINRFAPFMRIFRVGLACSKRCATKMSSPTLTCPSSLPKALDRHAKQIH
jgi:hypothetical protein